MSELCLSLTNLPELGQDFFFSEQYIWTKPIEEFGLSYRVQKSLEAEVFIMVQEKGCFVSGSIKGRIVLPCSRCAEDMPLDVDRDFKVFEILPEEKTSPDIWGPDFLRYNNENLEIDIAGILWEQFVLALPEKPLCSEDCLGICPHCGQNKNLGLCKCGQDKNDPRMETFRKLKLKK